MKKLIAAIVVAFLATFGLVAPAQADDRPNYTVTEAGVQLPSGYKFEAHGHVNVKWQDASGKTYSGGMHFDPLNNQPGGYYIGKSFFDFTSVIKDWDDCVQVTWVQVHGWNYHYTADYDPNKCPTPPGDEDDDSDNSSDDTTDSGATMDDDGSKDGTDTQDSDGDKNGTDNPEAADDSSKDSDASKDGDKANDGSKDGSNSDHDSTSIDDDNADTSKDADGGKDGGEIPPTGISGMVLSIMLGVGLIIVGVLTVINSRGKSAKH